MDTISELYYGRINPSEMKIEYGSNVRKLTELAEKIEKELHHSLSDEQKEQFDTFRNCIDELSAESELEMFSIGFRLGARLMIDITQEQPQD